MPGAALAPIIGTALGSATTGAILGGVIDAIVFGAAAQLLTRKGAPTGDRSRGRILSPIDPTAPHEIAYGSARKGGSIVWRGVTGDDGEFLWLLVAYHGREANDFVTFWAGGRSFNASGNGVVTDPQFQDSLGNNLLYLWERLGAPGQTHISQLSANFPAKFTVADIGHDTAYVLYRLERDQTAGAGTPSDPWFQGVPDPWSITGTWSKVYDPRKDDTNGGSGTHRRDDPTTWEVSANGVLHARDWLTSAKHGFALDTFEEIDDAVIAAEADAAEELVAVPSGTQVRYESGGVLSTGNTKGDNLAQILAAIGGSLAYSQGKMRVHCGHATPAALTLTPSDWLEPVRVQYGTERGDRYNFVAGTFFDSSRDWRQYQFPGRTDPQYVTDDNGEARKAVDYSQVHDWWNAQRLALVELEKGRRKRQLTCIGKPYLYPDLAVMDTVLIDDPEEGLVQQKFRCTQLGVRRDNALELLFVEEDDSVYTPDVSKYEPRPPE